MSLKTNRTALSFTFPNFSVHIISRNQAIHELKRARTHMIFCQSVHPINFHFFFFF